MCYNKPLHIHEECSKLIAVVREYLNKQCEQGEQGRGRGTGCGRTRGGPAVAAISMADVQGTMDTLPGADSAFLPSNWIVGSGSEINICFNHKQFAYIGPSDVSE